MGRGLIFLFWIICSSLPIINVSGCQLQGVNPVLVRVTINIWDVDRGVIYENQIIDITGVVDVVQNPGLNSGPYIRGYISGTTFYLETNDDFAQYEENETEASIILNAQFRCSDGTSITQVFQVNVQDTNNNSPEFIPSNEYEFAIATPMLPGFQITGCGHNIVVRDIDLTTSRIDFSLTGSDLFQIEYDEASSTTAKEFVAILRTSTFISSLPEPVELTISATDVDATGDPPRTSYATVKITVDSSAVLPEQPVFSQPLYTATYTEDNTIILDVPISLQQGYHEDVTFSLNEEYSSYFAIIRNENDVTLTVSSPLSAEMLTRQQLFIIIRADREFTSGATATIVVQLPEEIGLQFERANYEGVIEDNTLTLTNLVLTQGYEGADVSVTVSNDFFSAAIQGNIITLSMLPLTQEIIDENTFLNLEVTAQTERSSATTIVTLEIVKDDTVTPVFQSPIYIGSYDNEIGLTLGEIELTQGFDSTVEITLAGEHSTYFQLIRNGAISTVTVESLPLEELGEQTIILSIHASKPRTVGATASIYISLPEEVRLAFEQASYEGSIIDNTLQVPNLILTQGYENLPVTVTVSNEFFTASIQENVITLSMGQITAAVIQENSFLNLEVTATTSRSSASTVVTLEIIKNDTTTPLFENALYSGTYTEESGVTLGQINIIQGYDDTVNVILEGEHSNLFQLVRNGASSTLTGTIPADLFSQRNIALTVTATKPRTVGSTAVINIALPTDRALEFEATTYKGTYQNNILAIGVITLSSGYDDTVVFQLSDYNQYFEATNTLNQVSIQQLQPLPDSIVSENNFLSLTLTASGLNALSASTSLLIEIIKDDTSTPVFSRNIYSGTYADRSVVIQDINLIQGFDNTVSFRLDGDNSEYFSLNHDGNAVTVSLTSAVPEEIIFNQKALVFSILAEKPLTVGANAAIFVTFPSELTDPVIMRFSQNTYIGSLEDGNLAMESIVLNTGYVQGTQFFLTGEYSSYFALSNTNDIVSITTTSTLPQEVIEENKFIVLEVEARRDRAVSAFSSIVIELVHDEKVVDIPVFNAAYYRGSYSLNEGLQFTEQVYLVQGYDDTVSFELQGEHSEYFSVSDNNNVITLSASAIPENVWENNDQLIFSLIANKPELLSGRAAIVIDMPKEISETTVLGFERSYYMGSLADENVNLDAITLVEGYSEDVSFTLNGELQSYFTLSRNEATVNLLLLNAIPEESLPSNGIIVLEIQASKTGSLPTLTTVILEVIRETTADIDNLVFERVYYAGTYTTSDGLTLENSISLAEGYDDSVQFTLEGADSSYFSIVQTANNATLTVDTPIPPAVIANNNQLIFIINAQSASGATARATIVIALPNEISDSVVLGFERANYLGSVENEVLILDPIVLTEGYTSNVTFTLHGDLQNYFTLSQNGATVTLLMPNSIPENSLPTNGIIILEVQASTTTDALPAVTTVILEVVRDSTPEVQELMFTQTYYLGTYTTTDGLTFENTISLAQGYDESVQFTLDGDDSSYFAITQNGNSAVLTLQSAIPPGVIANNNQLVFVVSAQSSEGAIARSAIVIALPNEIGSDAVVLGFERTSYLGSVNNEEVTLDPITLAEGYTEDVIFTLHGELQSYFTLSRNGATVNLLLPNAIPEESLPSNNIIVLEIQASTTTGALPAVTTVVLEVIRDTTPEMQNLVFSQTFYVGTYTTTDGLSLESYISLTEGYGDDVQFTLEGNDSAYFGISQSGNSLSLTLSTAIPPAVIANNNHLVFVISAQSSGGAIARATIVIALPNEISDSNILGFERTSYQGSVNNEVVTLDPITLSEGYTDDVIFTLHGELQSYFTLSRNGATVNLVLLNAIPEESIPSNGIIVLEIQASTTTDALPAITTIVLEVIRDAIPEIQNLVFSQTFYVGTYTTTDGLSLESTISLMEGYDDDVQFSLEGDNSAYFGILQSGNSLSLTLNMAIPPAVIANNNQLIFVINAQSSDSATARATIVIILPNEISDSVILGFERTSYLGSINNEVISLDPITLSEGYSDAVVFTLLGDLQSYFSLLRNGATVTLQLSNAIPEASIPENGIIILDIQASSTTDALPAVTTVILEFIKNTTSDIEELVFAQTFYLGTYTTTQGLAFENTIALAQGYDESVQFTLYGDDSIYFTISQNGNSASLTLQSAIPPAVIANNNQLVFVVNAQSSGGANARATIVISLPNDISDNVILGFERTSYQGSVNNDVVTLDSITLSEGYTADVIFTLHGDLQSYFVLSRSEATVNLLLSNAIPEESLPTNGIIVLEIQASTITDALPAITTIILEVIRDTTPDIQSLEFSQTFYIGTYTTMDGLSLESTISLVEGYDENVQFTLQGDDSTYFGISQSGNSLSLTLSTTIPPAVIANNNQLIFAINAQSSSGAAAQATIMITLPNEISGSVILGFERTSYVGSLNNEAITLDQITLSEGYSDNVLFTLHGDLQNYFTLSRNGATVTLQLLNSIPENAIPSNQLIILDVQASTTTDALPAITTIILEVIRDTTPDIPNLVFSQTFYVGTYTATDGLSLESIISLAEGYDDNIQFTLEGDDAIYFGISQSGNSVTLTLNTAIPPAVIANNNQLIFVISAQSSGGATAQATIIVTLPNEISDSVILGFERTNYLGSLNNEAIILDPITLSEGYNDAVFFTLHGVLQSYFTLSRNGATVTLQLANSIPEDLVPTNGLIILEVQASTTTDALPAVTTVILEVIRDATPDIPDLTFSQTFYIGTYTTTDGLSLESIISLAEGYDDNIQFTLEGDDAIYFGISQSGNSLTLTLNTAIPPAVIANNNQLIFVISAQSSGGATAQATIIVTLPNEISDSVILGFERINYVGSLNNDAITLDPITLSEGYSNAVVFTLHGVLQSYFTLSRNGATVSLQLANSIPEDLVPTNGLIILEVQASTSTDALPAITTVILEVIRDATPDIPDLTFSQTFYIGTYTTTDGLSLESIISLAEGYDDNIQFTLEGDDAIYFGISQSGNSLTLTLNTAIPPAVIANNNQLIFVISAQSSDGATAQATIIVTLPNEISDSVILGFERTNYVGSLNNDAITLDPITLSEGYSDAVVFTLHGVLQNYFTLSRNGATVTLQLANSIPEDLVPINGLIILEVQASTSTNALPAITTVILEVIRDATPDIPDLTFSQTFYIGTYTTTDGLSLESIISLAEGYDDNIQFTLEGDDAIYFGISQSGNSLTLTLNTAIPPAVIANNNQLIFVISAQSSGGATAQATIIVTLPNEISDSVILGFERTNYVGSLNNDAITLDPITLSEGYSDAVVFTLHGVLQSYFTLSRNGATVSLQLANSIPEDLVPTNGLIILEVQASTSTDALPAITTVILEVIKDATPDIPDLVFSQTFYVGTYTATDGLYLESAILLVEGYDDNVQFTLEGDDAIYFGISQSGNSLSLILSTAIPPAVIANNNQLIFTINAQSSGGATARATIIIALPNESSDSIILGFERTNYLGSVNNEGVTLDPITLSEGYSDAVVFTLYGELESYFGLSRNGATVIVELQTAIPEDLMPTNGIIILGVQAAIADTLPAVATIVLQVKSSDGGPTVIFSKILYEGLMQGDTIEHETITVTGYEETTTVEIRGVYSELFTASLVGGVVTVQRTGSVTLPTDVAHVAVEIHVGDAAAVLLLQVLHTDTPNPPPTVTFSASNYVVRAEVLQTGVIGRVSAAADNGESLIYSVVIEDAHLAARLSVNSDGELLLSSPANTGEYTFQVVATTIITQAMGTATVQLTVDENSIVLPPLIVLDRDEEEPHENLVVFSSSEYADCTYTLTNRFPANQEWLYVNATGLHAHVIDREDPSIAFMALSQVQVELEVHCNSLTRNKRSIRESRLEWLGPYDYGNSNWILGESIEHNPTRSVVNLIVNDINDNAPIFVGKENEPIAVGYPVPELEDVVLPRALAELQATDADIGENAAIVYWSAEPALAVSPTSGSVHVRDDVTLEQDQALVVQATDRNGLGLSASINLVVKLLDETNIAVVTIRDAFLEDEANILANLSSSVGYEVKVLRAVMISDETESVEENISTRKIRQTTGSGATLELYVYGLVQREPVAVEILTEDINANAIDEISIASTISLRDFLQARQISSGRDTGLLVATIVLSILIFILIVAILIWFFLKWRKDRNYDEFSDENSLESRKESIEQPVKSDIRPKPRIDIDELKRSERRLQEMIDAPYNELLTPTTSTTSTKVPVESIIDISEPEPNILVPIVINDKLKDADEEPSDIDEFGEVRPPRRKSVVTFNENVERIIHVDDNDENNSMSSDVEVFRL